MNLLKIAPKLKEGDEIQHPGFKKYQVYSGQFIVSGEPGKRAFIDLNMLNSDQWKYFPKQPAN